MVLTAVLVLVLILVFATSGSKEPMGEVSDAVTETQMEEIELRHRADSREIFARGALKAAAFAAGARPGLYDMEDVLFGGK